MYLKLANVVSSIFWFWHNSIDLYNSLSLNISNGIQDTKELFIYLERADQREFSLFVCEDIMKLGLEETDSDSKVRKLTH